MTIEKTASGIFALTMRRQLAPKERQLLILSNGSRSLAEFVDIFGHDCIALLEKLETAGLLRGVIPSKPAPAATTLAAAPVDGFAGPKRAKNRSLAACKIYVIDLLQLQQTEGAVLVVQALRQSNAANSILESLLVALDLILVCSGERYMERVAKRIFEIMPDEQLNLFIRLALEMHIPILDLVAKPYVGLLAPTPAAV